MKLKTCPFCGGNNAVKTGGTPDTCGDYFVDCHDCGGYAPLEAWNTRAIPEPTEEQIVDWYNDFNLGGRPVDDEYLSYWFFEAGVKAMIKAQEEA